MGEFGRTPRLGTQGSSDGRNHWPYVMSMCLAFGAAFEVPVVVVILVRMGLVSIGKLKEIRPYAVVGAFVVAAIVTPPDAVSMFSLAIPMCLLFELGLLVAPMFVRLSTAPEENA